ncbi:MAG: hypothetical protein AB1629_06880 [Candidatus Omnitrophota bacterium]
MDKRTLEARIRQLYAIDKNALDVYTDLVENSEDKSIKDRLSQIAEDEKRHIKLSERMLDLLKND